MADQSEEREKRRTGTYDHQVQRVTQAMSRRLDELLQAVASQSIRQLDGINVRRIVEVNIQIADDYGWRPVRSHHLHQIIEVILKCLRNATGAIHDCNSSIER
jgi:hypothetical protein